MLRRILLPALALLALGLAAPQASAANHGMYAGFPFGFGFYQPYGVRYSTSVRTPPYFALNPPVYYGGRHYRPYGASPFASLPLVEAGSGYTTRPADRSTWLPPRPPMMNPHCCGAEWHEGEAMPELAKAGRPVPAPIRENPFATGKLARAESPSAR